MRNYVFKFQNQSSKLMLRTLIESCFTSKIKWKITWRHKLEKSFLAQWKCAKPNDVCLFFEKHKRTSNSVMTMILLQQGAKLAVHQWIRDFQQHSWLNDTWTHQQLSEDVHETKTFRFSCRQIPSSWCHHR